MLRYFLVALLVASAYAFELASNDFADGETIPQIHTCDHSGYGVSPALQWRNAPRQTSHFALLCVDDSSYGQFNHWFLANIPATVNYLPRGVTPNLLANVAEMNAFIPFCPPYGMKREYKFELYALRESVNLPEDLAEARTLLKSVAIDVAQLTGVYGDKPVPAISKRSVEETLDFVFLNTTTIPTTTLNANNFTTFTFPLTNTIPFSGDQSARVIVTFTLTVTSGTVCFNADFTSNATAGTPLACASSANGSPQANIRIEKNTVEKNFTFSLIAVSGASSAVFSGSYSVSQVVEPAVTEVTYEVAVTLVLKNGDIKPFVGAGYPALPALLASQVLNVQITAVLDLGLVDADPSLQICAYGGFTPISTSTNDMSAARCFRGGSGKSTISFSQNFVKGTFPGRPYIVVFAKSLNKRNILDLPVTVTINTPLLQAITIPNGTPGSETCDTWTVINFSFADLITK